MSANLGATTYTDVTWTTGDYITEAKLDSMVANDQAYDSHSSNGIRLDNTIAFASRDSGDADDLNLIRLDSGDDVEIGDSGAGEVKIVANPLKTIQTYQDLVTDSDGATITFNMATGNLHTVVLGGNRTLAVSNEKVGQGFVVRLQQDGTGSRTVTWWSDINWDNNTAPTLTTTANRVDVFGFLVTSSGNYDGYVLGQNIPL